MTSKTCGECGAQLSDSANFCTQCGVPVRAETKSGGPDKRQEQSPPSGKDRVPKTKLLVMGLFGGIIIVLILVFINFLTVEEHGVIAAQPTVGDTRDYGNRTVEMTEVPSEIRDDHLVFSLEDIVRYELVRVEYRGATAIIPVLAYISPRGKLVTAISISEPCNATHFTIIGNTIKCNNCAANWDLNTMQAYACCPNNYPDPIPSLVVGNEVRVAIETLENWRRRL